MSEDEFPPLELVEVELTARSIAMIQAAMGQWRLACKVRDEAAAALRPFLALPYVTEEETEAGDVSRAAASAEDRTYENLLRIVAREAGYQLARALEGKP